MSQALTLAQTPYNDSTMSVVDGYGEYLIYRPSGNPVDDKIFEKAYSIIYNLTYSTDSQVDSLTSLLSGQISQIDQDLEVTFLPRTLYELFFLHQAIKEEVKEHGCIFQTKNMLLECLKHPEEFPKKHVEALNHGCWHTYSFSSDEEEFEINNPRLIKMAYKLNAYIVRKMQPHREPFSGAEIVNATEKQIEFLKKHKQTYTFPIDNYHAQEAGLALNFGVEKSELRGHRAFQSYCKMAVDNPYSAQVIRNAVALECSALAHNALLMYRGGDLNSEQQLDPEIMKKTSLSFHTGLFAASTRDPTACPHKFISEGREGYVVIIAKDQINNAPYFYPRVCALAMLLFDGELHPRTLVSREENKTSSIKSLLMHYSDPRIEQIKSDQSADALLQQLSYYQTEHSYRLTSEL